MTQSVLVLGASGRFGRHACQAFQTAGWHVARFDRHAGDLDTAARGADVIVNGWNPAYPDWAKQVPRLHAQVRAAALKHNATVVLPGNVYVFGAETPTPWSENSPHNASNPLGRIRKDMERAYAQDGVKTIVLRAGDFLDTEASGNWFDRIIVPNLAKGRLTYPGRCDIPHAWAFLPDLAYATVALCERRDNLPEFADIPFPGLTLSGHEIANVLSEVTDRPVRARPMNWLALQMARPFWPMARALCEMRYLWNTPHSLDDTALSQLLPDFSNTSSRIALAHCVAHLGLGRNDQIHPNKTVPAGPHRNVMTSVTGLRPKNAGAHDLYRGGGQDVIDP